MHILILLAQHHWTGPAEPVLQIARALLAEGNRVTFVYTRRPAGHLAGHVEGKGFQTLPQVSLMRKGFHPLAACADWFRLRRFVQAEKVDAILCNHSHDHHLALALRIGLKNKPPVIRQIHESRHLNRSLDRATTYRFTDAFIVPSEGWGNDLVKDFGIASDKIHVLLPGVDTAYFSPEQNVNAIREEVSAGPSDKLVGLVSRIKPGRGHEQALAAMEIVRKTNPGAKLLFIGRGEGKTALEAEVERRGAGEWAHFLGYRTDDLPAVYAALDVKLLLGEGSDGTCRAAFESLACGTPVVARPVGALGETLTDGQSGFFTDGTAEDLADKILLALNEPQMKEKARQYVTGRYNLEKRGHNAVQLLMKIVEKR